MQVISRPRQAGKTTDLIDIILKDSEGLLIVPNYGMLQDIERRFPLMKDQVITWRNVVNKEGLKGHRKNLYIDNADMILQGYCEWRIKAVTLSEGEE